MNERAGKIGRGLLAIVEVTAFYAGPILFLAAYADSFGSGQGLTLAFASVTVGLMLWGLVTFTLEGRFRGSAMTRRAPARALAIGLVGAIVAYLAVVVARLPSFPLAFVVGVYVTHLVYAVIAQGSPQPVPGKGGRRRLSRRVWVLVAMALLVVGCTVSITPMGPRLTHRFTIYGYALEVDVESPVLLGQLVRGDPARAVSAQFTPDGRALFVTWLWGGCQALWSADAVPATPDVLAVDVRIGSRCWIPGAMAASLSYAAARIELDTPVDPSNPPAVIDASGAGVVVEPYQE